MLKSCTEEATRNKNYGWNISYTVEKDGAVVADGVINECVEGAGMSYVHEPLGNTGASNAHRRCLRDA